jgi:hypothetical protein
LTTVSTILKYNLTGSVGSVGENPYRAKAKLEQLQNFRYVDKLNRLTELTVSVPNNEYTRSNAFIERDAYLPLVTPFRGMVLNTEEDEKEIQLMAQEKAFHLTRRIFRNDDEDDSINYTSEDWYDKLWKHRQKYTVIKTHVQDEIKEYPINVNLGANESFRRNAQLDGDDFVVTAKDGITKVPHEIESYDSVTGDLVLWARIPKVSDSSSIDFYVYYDNEDATNQEDVVNVWKGLYKKEEFDQIVTYAYDAVWHLNEDAGTPDTLDSTENNNDGTDLDITYVTGKIGNAAQFNALTSEINCQSDTSLDNIFAATGGAWVTCWFNANSDGEGSTARLLDKANGAGPAEGWILYVVNEANGLFRIAFKEDRATTDSQYQTDVIVPINRWHRVDFWYDDSSTTNDPLMWIDGVEYTVPNGLLNETSPGSGAPVSDAGYDFRIGNILGGSRTFDGEIEEVRVMKSPPLDLDHIIKTEYMIQNKPDGCLIAHPHEEYSKQADLIAKDILDSANSDMPVLSSTDISNLIALYRLDKNALDSKNSNDLTWNGTEDYTKEGVFAIDKAANLNGSSRINGPVTGLPIGSADRSVSCWFRYSEQGVQDYLWEWGVQTTRNVFAGLLQTSGVLTVVLWGDDRDSSTVFQPNIWYHVVITLGSSGTVSNMYVNGILDTNFPYTHTGTANTTSSDFFIGSNVGGTNNLTGQIDDVRIYDKELTAEEVRKLYQMTQSDVDTIQRKIKWVVGDDKATEIPNLVGLWKLDGDLVDSVGDADVTDINVGASGTGTETYAEGKYNKGFEFDDAKRLTIKPTPSAYDLQRLSGWTWSMWVKSYDSTTLPPQATVFMGRLDSLEGYQIYQDTDGKIKYTYRNTAGTTVGESSVVHSINDGKMHHILWKKSTAGALNANFSLFIDGVKQTINNISDGFTTGSINYALALELNFGAQDNVDGGFEWAGVLDDVRFYDRELTDDECKEIYEATSSGIDIVRSDGFPSDTTSIGYNFKNHWEALDKLALLHSKDLWFDNENFRVFIGTKGKTIDGQLDITITSRPQKKTENFSNVRHLQTVC